MASAAAHRPRKRPTVEAGVKRRGMTALAPPTPSPSPQGGGGHVGVCEPGRGPPQRQHDRFVRHLHSRACGRLRSTSAGKRTSRSEVVAVGEIQHPEHCHVSSPGVLVAADRAVEPAAAELRLAFGRQVEEVPSSSMTSMAARIMRVARRPELGPDEVEIVGRGVIFGELRRTGCAEACRPAG